MKKQALKAEDIKKMIKPLGTSAIDARDYEASLQWRFYLLIHEGACFRYNLFDFANPKEGCCELRDIVSVRFWPYAGLESECRAWLKRFIEWAGDRRLLGLLDRRAA